MSSRVETHAADTSVDLPLLRLVRVLFRRGLTILVVFLVLAAAAVLWATSLVPKWSPLSSTWLEQSSVSLPGSGFGRR